VDDETPVRRLIKILLVRQGFEVVEAEDGLSALSTLQERKGDLSLIVSDVRMPRLDGIALCQQVKEDFPHIPVLLISGNEPDACRVGDRYLQKPLHSETFLSAPFEIWQWPSRNLKARPNVMIRGRS
jgi:two-component system OmpR family response regulator